MVFILLIIGFLSLSSVSAESLSDSDTSDLSVFEVDSGDDSDISALSVFEADSVEDSDIAESSESLLKISSEDNSNVEIMRSDSENEDEKSSELINRIQNAQANEIITIEPGTYRIHNLTLAKNITLQGKGYNEVVIDGEYLGSVFLIHDPEVFVNFYNLTIIHGLTDNFGGGICIETGNAHVNNCVFINNSALNVTNGGAISNYGDEDYRSYLLVNNSVFLGNHADHDGGAITTCYATSDIYNSVFMNNSARRDGGAIRVSIFGLGNVQDCVFMYNHADEWAGAYYSWAGNSSIDRCIFMNNTAGTNGGAIMISGSANVTNNIIVNNTADLTGGSFYIQQPMFNATTIINVNNNIITNNTAPLGQEVFIKWNDIKYLFPNFNQNYWEEEDPFDSDVIDPNNVTKRSKPKDKIDNPGLFDTLRFDLLDIYSGIIDDYFSDNADGGNDNNDDTKVNPNETDGGNKFKPSDMTNNQNGSDSFWKFNNTGANGNDDSIKNQLSKNSLSTGSSMNKNHNSTYVSTKSDNQKMVELIEGDPISLKSFNMAYIVVLAIILLIFFAGLLKRRDRSKFNFFLIILFFYN